LILLLAAEKSAGGVFVHFRPLLFSGEFLVPEAKLFSKNVFASSPG